MGNTEAKPALDDAVEKFIKAEAGDGNIVTGWVIGISLKNINVPNSDGYVVENSDGMPYHSQIGLITSILDEKKNTILSQIIKEG